MEIPMFDIVSHSRLTYKFTSKHPLFTCDSTLTRFFFFLLKCCPTLHPEVDEEPTCVICNYFYRQLTPLQKADLGLMFMLWVQCPCTQMSATGENCRKLVARDVEKSSIVIFPNRFSLFVFVR